MKGMPRLVKMHLDKAGDSALLAVEVNSMEGNDGKRNIRKYR